MLHLSIITVSSDTRFDTVSNKSGKLLSFLTGLNSSLLPTFFLLFNFKDLRFKSVVQINIPTINVANLLPLTYRFNYSGTLYS